MVAAFYTSQFEKGSVPSMSQSASRSRRLKAMVQELHKNSSQWPRWEARGLQESTVESAGTYEWPLLSLGISYPFSPELKKAFLQWLPLTKFLQRTYASKKLRASPMVPSCDRLKHQLGSTMSLNQYSRRWSSCYSGTDMIIISMGISRTTSDYQDSSKPSLIQ